MTKDLQKSHTGTGRKGGDAKRPGPTSTGSS